MTTRSSSTDEASSGIVSGNIKSLGDETHDPCYKTISISYKYN